jgi:hypothetical protein
MVSVQGRIRGIQALQRVKLIVHAVEAQGIPDIAALVQLRHHVRDRRCGDKRREDNKIRMKSMITRAKSNLKRP